MSIANEPKFPKPMIENQEHAGNNENHLGNFQIVARMNPHRRLEETHDVVADVTNCAAGKMRNIAWCHKVEPCHKFLQLGERIAFALGAVENHQRIESDE